MTAQTLRFGKTNHGSSSLLAASNCAVKRWQIQSGKHLRCFAHSQRLFAVDELQSRYFVIAV